jgi:hypothetical protein
MDDSHAPKLYSRFLRGLLKQAKMTVANRSNASRASIPTSSANVSRRAAIPVMHEEVMIDISNAVDSGILGGAATALLRDGVYEESDWTVGSAGEDEDDLVDSPSPTQDYCSTESSMSTSGTIVNSSSESNFGQRRYLQCSINSVSI